MSRDPHEALARHLSAVGMGYPYREELLEILRTNFTEEEAETALLLPTGGLPLEAKTVEEIAARSGRPAEELGEGLAKLAARGLLFSGKNARGEVGYALHQVGYGFPQSFFWRGEDTPHAREMTRLVLKYFNRETTAHAFAGSETKPYRYVPVDQSLRPDLQAVLPHHAMDAVLDGASRFALAHCPCRVQVGLLGKGCNHPIEVCLKFDELAGYLIDRGLGREITRDEARDVVRQSAEAGLVHFVDNARGRVKHNCNCCGCACWNVGSIRRRKIPRDALMATYFLRRTDEDRCAGCGRCAEVCPVDAVRMDGATPRIDEAWCIGCGVCARACDFEAVELFVRPDRQADLPEDFETLHRRIRAEKEHDSRT
ncbi:MAG: 4Fe-4S binding protein [Deltaproteobacteria bacterium]|nr:4Fe-4S binding protein [Deltaproteobacteria bacterium]